jgi:hypothetical protein
MPALLTFQFRLEAAGFWPLLSRGRPASASAPFEDACSSPGAAEQTPLSRPPLAAKRQMYFLNYAGATLVLCETDSVSVLQVPPGFEASFTLMFR